MAEKMDSGKYSIYLNSLLQASRSTTLSKKLKALCIGLQLIGWDKISICTYTETLQADEYFIVGFDDDRIEQFNGFRVTPDGRSELLQLIEKKKRFFLTWDETADIRSIPPEDVRDIYKLIGYKDDESPQGIFIPLKADSGYVGSMHLVKDDSANWDQDIELIELYARFAAHIIDEYKLKTKIDLVAAHYQKVFENSIDIMSVIDKKLAIVLCNKRFRKMFELKKDEAPGKQFTDFILGDKEEFRHAVNESLSGTIQEFRSRIKNRADEIRDIRITIKPQVVETIEPQLELVIDDITDELLLKQHMLAVESKYKLLFENAGEGIALLNLKGEFVSINKAGTELLGYTEKELEGEKFSDFLKPNTGRIALLLFDRLIHGKGLRNRKIEVLQKNANPKPLSVSVAPLKAEDGSISGAVIIARDLSAEYRALEEKEKSEQEYQRILDNFLDIFYKCDIDDTIQYLNPAAGEILHNSNYKKLIGKKLIDTLCVNKAAAKQALKILYRDGEVRNSPLVIRRADGVEIFCEENSHIIYNDASKPIGREGIIRDITERRKTQDALIESEEQYRTLMKNLPVGIYRTTTDPEGTALYLNPAFLKIFGYDSLEEMRKKDVVDLYFNQERRKKLLKKLLSEGKTNNEQFRMKKKNGDFIWVSDTCNTIRDENGIIIYLDGILEDITEKKKLEEELRNSEKRYRLLAENSHDIIWTLDLDLNYTYTSPSVAFLTGFSPEELLGESVRKSLTPESWEKVQSVFQQRLKERLKVKDTESTLSITLEIQLLTKHGSPVWVEANSVFMRDESGMPAGILGVTRDITERKRAEKQLAEQLRQLDTKVKERTKELAKTNQELIRSNKVKSEFLANISHELRSPLTSIMGYTEMMSSMEQPKSDYSDYLEIISTQATQLHKLVNSLLDISKIDAGSIKRYLTPTNLNDIVKLVEKHSKFKVEEAEVGLIVKPDPKIINVFLDGQKVYQIIRNLLDNAIKFSRVGNKIIISTNRLDNMYQIKVTDEGIGITKEKLQRIFEPFYQADSSSTRSYDGAGLGLYLVKSYITLHDGEIEVESEPGKGTVFTASLPINLKPVDKEYVQDRRITGPMPVINIGKKKVLVVDDDREIADLITIVLKKTLEIYTAQNGKEGVEKAKELKPDLVLMDLSMPVLDGYEATKIIKDDPSTRDIPVIALSARAMKSEIDRALAAGCNDHMSKPFKLRDLQKMINKYIN